MADETQESTGPSDDELIDQFEASWQSDSARDVAKFVRSLEVNVPANVLAELVHIDLECRLKRCEEIRVEKYFVQFPELTSDSEISMALIAAEFKLRSRADQELVLTNSSNASPISNLRWQNISRQLGANRNTKQG